MILIILLLRINPTIVNTSTNYISLNDQTASVTIRYNTNTEPADVNTIMEVPF